MHDFSLPGACNIYIFLKTPAQAGCVPTVPATPVLSPPLDHVPRLPLSAETLAKIRLGNWRGGGRDRLVGGWQRPLSWMVESGNEDDEEESEKKN